MLFTSHKTIAFMKKNSRNFWKIGQNYLRIKFLIGLHKFLTFCLVGLSPGYSKHIKFEAVRSKFAKNKGKLSTTTFNVLEIDTNRIDFDQNGLHLQLDICDIFYCLVTSKKTVLDKTCFKNHALLLLRVSTRLVPKIDGRVLMNDWFSW